MKLSSLQPRTIGHNLFASRMALLYIWVKFYNGCVDRPLQPDLFHPSTKAHKMTSTIDCRTHGLRCKATTQERKQDDCCCSFEPEDGSYCPGGNEMSFRSSSIPN